MPNHGTKKRYISIVEAPPVRNAQRVSAINPPTAIVYVGGFLASTVSALAENRCTYSA